MKLIGIGVNNLFYVVMDNNIKALFDVVKPLVDDCSKKLVFQPSIEDYALQLNYFYSKFKDELIIEALTAIGFDYMDEKYWNEGKFHNYPDGTQEFIFLEVPLFRINLNIGEDKIKVEKFYRIN